MKQEFDRVMRKDENGNLVPEKHLYRRRYQNAAGKWLTRYYALFTDWKGIRRRLPLGETLERSRNKLGELRRKNDAEFDFDKAKAERAAKEMTFRNGQGSARKPQTMRRASDCILGRSLVKRRSRRSMMTL